MDPAWWAAGAASVGVVVTGLVGWANWRQARRGPLLGPDWRLDAPTTARHGGVRPVELRNVGAPARNVELHFLDPQPHRVDGSQRWERFARGQREVLLVAYTRQTNVSVHARRVRLTWTPVHTADPGEWESALPVRAD